MGAKNFHPTGIRTTALSIHAATPPLDPSNSATPQPILYYQLWSTRDHSKMMIESMKKSLEKLKNVLEKRKIVKRKICIKKHSR